MKKNIFLGILLSGVFFLVVGVIGFIFISRSLPQIHTLDDYQPPIISKVFSHDGELILEVAKQRREIVAIDQVPRRIINAFLSAEDDKFYEHSGVDYLGIIRAMIKNIMAGRIVQGASTITQQVAKSLLLSQERTFSRKIKDLILAHKIESRFTKDEILFLYLNQVYFGGGYYGIKAAAKGYFEKQLDDLTIGESALLAGLLVAPGRYSPYVNPQYAKKRQLYVLSRMLTTGKITQEEYDLALDEDIKIARKDSFVQKGGHYTDFVRQSLLENIGKEELMTNGYEVKVAMNWSLQEKAEKAIVSGLEEIDKRQGYKGPIKKLNTEDEIKQELENIHLENLEEVSDFYLFTKSGEKIPDYKYYNQDFIISKNFLKKDVTITFGEDRFNRVIGPKKKTYQAVVENIFDDEKLIHAKVGYVSVLIPHEGYKWAHKRDIKTSRHYWGYINKPSEILSRGDVIEVKLRDEIIEENALIELLNIKKIEVEDKETFAKSENDDSLNQGEQQKNLSEAQEIAQLKKEEIIRLERERPIKVLVADLYQTPIVEGALVSIDSKTGHVISLVGGRDFNVSQFNRAIQAKRQPGSAYKPFIYASALEKGFQLNSILLDTPQSLGGADEFVNWKPRNYDGEFKGEMTFRNALEVSRNIPTIKLTQDVGVEYLKNFSLRLGLKTEYPKDLSISLGSFGIDPLQLTNAYATFIAKGKKVEPKFILEVKNRFNEVINLENLNHKSEEELNNDLLTQDDENTKPNPEVDQVLMTENSALIDSDTPSNSLADTSDQENGLEKQLNLRERVIKSFRENLDHTYVYDQRLAFLMSELLKGIIQSGTGRGAKGIGQNIGGKTGTTNNYIDAWFVGFASEYAVGVWTGNDDNQSMGWPETGALSALPIWKEYVQQLLEDKGDLDQTVPPGIVKVNYDQTLNNETKTVSDYFVEGLDPTVKNISDTPIDEETNMNESPVFIEDDFYDKQ